MPPGPGGRPRTGNEVDIFNRVVRLLREGLTYAEIAQAMETRGAEPWSVAADIDQNQVYSMHVEAIRMSTLDRAPGPVFSSLGEAFHTCGGLLVAGLVTLIVLVFGLLMLSAIFDGCLGGDGDPGVSERFRGY